MALAFIKSLENSKNPKKTEQKLKTLSFNIFKFNHRPKPKKKDRVVIISCFSEFGCETIGCMYCLPKLIKRFPGQYIIAMGWYGREYLYRHLVDEFWEVKEESMWLREYTRAFHHISDNLKRLEEAASAYGTVIPSSTLGKFAVGSLCSTCGNFWSEWRHNVGKCPRCKGTMIIESLFSNPKYHKTKAVRIPAPSKELQDWAGKLVGDKPVVGLFARGRKTYGRNLEPEFYVSLIQLLEQMGYGVVWLGEKQSTQACPVPHVLDFSRLPESRDLEKTLAIVSKCSFTIQFWTASTRLSGMLGVPFILFESPEQIYCTGLSPAQEGKRLELASFGPKKLVIAHYINVVEDTPKALSLVQRAVREIQDGDYEDIIGMVEQRESIENMQKSFKKLVEEV